MKIAKDTPFNMVIVNSSPDNNDFKPIFNDIPGEILVNPNLSKFNSLLRSHKDRPLIITGHGDESGVYNEHLNGYILSHNNVYLLRQLPFIIGVWCFAGNFADHFNLPGFYTSMFISNVSEAHLMGHPAPTSMIQEENIKFANLLNHLIKTEPDMSKWVDIFHKSINLDGIGSVRDTNLRTFVRYNYEALYYSDGKNLG